MEENKSLYHITLSVRTLVEFVYSSGDIDSRFFSMERAQEGSRIHRMLQKTSKDPYDAEVFFKHTCDYKDITFTIEGRADGIIKRDNEIIIDEIKTVTIPLEQIEIDYKDVHWAQAMCYAYFYCLQEKRSDIQVQLTYYQVEFETMKQFIKSFDVDELASFYQNLLAEYYKWAIMERDFKKIKTSSIKAMPFPFKEYREGQRKLAVAIYKTILDEDVLYVQAPTGIGKTISTLFPSIKAIGEDKIERIFYLTAKTITRTVAVDALQRMREHGLHLKSITLMAKDKMCFLEERNCDPEVCPFARNYYDRVHDAIYELINKHDAIDEDIIKSFGQKHQICPFELSLDLTLHCDVIICDYNYLFDPSVYLKRFFMDMPGKYMFLIDEAHNLVDRARSMFSAALDKQRFLNVKAVLPKDKKDLHKALRSLNQHMLELRKQCEETPFQTRKEPLEILNKELNHFLSNAEIALQEMEPGESEEQLRQLYFDVIRYMRIVELYDDHYVTILNRNQQNLEVKQFCIDPGKLVRNSLKKGTAACLFSATLTPIEYFLELLGGNEESKRLMLYSPFKQEHLMLMVNDAISTRYKNRQASLQPIAEMIYQSISMRKGNYIVYLPSYAYMRQIYEAFVKRHPNITTLLQHSAMNELEKEAFLSAFEENRDETLVGFCVIGGMYGEGIDLRGDALIGTIIIGVGLPQISDEQDILRDYFEAKNHMGYAYAYLFPGMNKVLQAAGRVIRTSEDTGFVLLIDDRYTTPIYQQLFPQHWNHYLPVRNETQLQDILKEFWKRDIHQ